MMQSTTLEEQSDHKDKDRDFVLVLQDCPSCLEKISALPGSRDAVCQNCGYKDPCCE